MNESLRREAAAAAGQTAVAPLDVEPAKDIARRVLMSGQKPMELSALDGATTQMREHIELLVPAIRALIHARPLGDTAAAVAQVGVDEAWRRLHTTRGFGQDAVRRQAKKMALSVCSLCDHYEHLRPPAS